MHTQQSFQVQPLETFGFIKWEKNEMLRTLGKEQNRNAIEILFS